MIVYKITDKNMTATHGQGKFQLKIGKNFADKANCAQTGIHAAENPLDCFNYYISYNKDNEYYLCDAVGDIDEDGNDSKISCTELDVIRKMTLKEFLACALLYMKNHPNRKVHKIVKSESGTATHGFVVVKGDNPKGKGEKKGDIIALCKGNSEVVEDIRIYQVDGKKFKPNVFYNILGEAVTK